MRPSDLEMMTDEQFAAFALVTGIVDESDGITDEHVEQAQRFLLSEEKRIQGAAE